MHVEEKTAMRILADARRCIDADHRQANELPDPQREHRVAEYARQVDQCGRITAWLPPAEPRTSYRSRFAYGDVLRPRR